MLKAFLLLERLTQQYRTDNASEMTMTINVMPPNAPPMAAAADPELAPLEEPKMHGIKFVA